MANKSKNPRYKEQGVKSVGGRNLIPPPYMYDQRRAMARDAMYPLEYAGIMAYDPVTGALSYPATELYNPPGATSPTATTPTSSSVVPPYQPQPNPYSLGAGAGNEPYAPVNTGAGGSGTPGNPDYDYWYKLAQDKEKWGAEEQAAYLAQFYGQTDEQGNLIGVGNPRWGDPYQVMPYWKYNQPTWVALGAGGALSKGRGRIPERYYIPEQQVYKTPGGQTYASRDGYEDALGQEGEPTNAVPAWVGPLVNWRT